MRQLLERTPSALTVVSMRQARLALLEAGLLDQVEAALAAIEDPLMRQRAQIEWEYATEVRRDSPWVGAIADALALSPDAFDQLFADAGRY